MFWWGQRRGGPRQDRTLRTCLPGRESVSGLWPEIGKMTEKWLLVPPRKYGKDGPEREKWPENQFAGCLSAIFQFLGHFFLILAVRPKSIFRPFFLFRARGPKLISSQAFHVRQELSQVCRFCFSSRGLFRHLYIYIYIYPVGRRGGPDFERFMSCEGAPQFLEKRFLPQKEANEELRGNPNEELRGSPKTG